MSSRVMVDFMRIAHSPDADDIFMFWAIATGKLRNSQYKFQVLHRDIEELNQIALRAKYEITALSFHAFFHVESHYTLLSSGASMAENNYGPRVVCRPEDLNRFSDKKEIKKIAVPGLLTTAALITKIFCPHALLIPMRFDRIMPAVQQKVVDAGVIIHEGQLFFKERQLAEVKSLGEVWHSLCLEKKNKILPLPLGGNAVRKDLGAKRRQELDRLCRESIVLATRRRQEVIAYLRHFRPDLSAAQFAQYLSWYANHRTLQFDADALEAIVFLRELV